MFSPSFTENFPSVELLLNNYIMGIQLFSCFSEKPGVALVLCQSDPVLNDGQSGSDPSSKTVIDGVRRSFIEKVVTQHEDDDDGSSSD